MIISIVRRTVWHFLWYWVQQCHCDSGISPLKLQLLHYTVNFVWHFFKTLKQPTLWCILLSLLMILADDTSHFSVLAYSSSVLHMCESVMGHFCLRSVRPDNADFRPVDFKVIMLVVCHICTFQDHCLLSCKNVTSNEIQDSDICICIRKRTLVFAVSCLLQSVLCLQRVSKYKYLHTSVMCHIVSMYICGTLWWQIHNLN